VKCLKACIHPITVGVIRIKEMLTSLYQTKDLSWTVNVSISEDGVKILHLRHEQSIKKLFEVQWKMSLTFDKSVKQLQEVWLNVTDLIFHEDTKEPTRYALQQLLKDLLSSANSKHKNSVILPSFVDLSNQQLTEVPENIFEMPKLQTLYLHFNNIDKLPEAISKLTNLQVLYLNQNKFTSFPKIVCSVPSIRELHLGRNRITDIPPEIGQMNLRELSLSYNLLTGNLPKELCKLTNLRKLYLHNNYLETIPPELASLPLKTLQIHNNQKMVAPLKDFGPNDTEELIKYLKALKP